MYYFQFCKDEALKNYCIMIKKNIVSYISILFLFSSPLLAQIKSNNFQFIDTHNDILSNQIITGIDLSKEQNGVNFDLLKAKRGHLAGQMFSIWCDEVYGPGTAFGMATREIDSLMALIHRNPNKITLVRNSRQLESAIHSGKLAAMIGVEGGHMIENRMDLLDSLYRRGMKYMTLTWNNSTPWATSARDETTKKDSLPFKGLTENGRQIVKWMNAHNILVDISHTGEKTFYDVLATTAKPVIASHSCSYTLNPNRRNLKDDQLRALAKNGGVVFLNFFSGFLDSTYQSREKVFIDAHKDEIIELTKLTRDKDLAIIKLFHIHQKETDLFRPPLKILINHIDYIVKLIGVDHVGIGSDFDGAESFPMQLDDVSNYPLIVTELQKLHYADSDIKKICSGNFIRVMKANEK